MDSRDLKISAHILLLIFLLVSGAVAEPPVLGTITYLSGNAQITDKDGAKRDELSPNDPLYDGEGIQTDTQSRCEINFRGKSVVRIDEHTRIEVKGNIQGSDNVTIKDGDIWLAHLLPETESAIEIETPSSACSIRGTVYRLSCDANHTTYRCYRGTIFVKPTPAIKAPPHTETFTIGKGEELILVSNFEEYMNQQKIEFNTFTKEKMEGFEQYRKEQTQAYDESVKRDLDSFQKMNGYYARFKPFDEKKDRASEWVRWNLERDKKLLPDPPQKFNSLRLNP